MIGRVLKLLGFADLHPHSVLGGMSNTEIDAHIPIIEELGRDDAREDAIHEFLASLPPEDPR